MANEIVKYESETGAIVEFTAQDVKDRLCPNIDDRELALVMALCQNQRLNPFIKDVYIIKYGNSPASIVTSKEVFTKRAQANPRFEGMEAGVTFLTQKGEIVQREGSMPINGWQLIGGWCKVYVKGYRVPIYDEVSLDEYNTGKSNWAKMPGTMVRKVAICHALREAFPAEFQQLYGMEEMGEAGQVAEIQNGTENRTTDTADAKSESFTDVEFVEMMNDDQRYTIIRLEDSIANAKGKTPEEVHSAVLNSASAREVGAHEGMDDMTLEQADAVITVLNSWLESCKPDEQLEDEDIPF